MTLTQNGSAVTGNLVQQTVDLGGFTTTFNGTISGTVSGTDVSLTSQLTFVTRGLGDALTCRGGDSWSGTISGSTLTGTFRPQSTAYVCDGGIPFPLTYPSGPMNFTRQ